MAGMYAGTSLMMATTYAPLSARSHVYVMELKRGGTAAEALAQIEDKGDAKPYAADPRRLHLIGCAFSDETRQLSDWAEA